MKTKIVLSLTIAMVAMFTLSMIPKKETKTKVLMPPFNSCTYQLKNYKPCAITVQYVFVTSSGGGTICPGTITVPGGSPGVVTIPCCTDVLIASVKILATSNTAGALTQMPGAVWSGSTTAGGAWTGCGGGSSFNVTWTPNFTSFN